MTVHAHTHRGHCQLCGRLQAVMPPGNLIAKHGYRVRGGYFSGTCQGAGHAPLEVERTYADTVIEGCRLAAKASDDYVHELLTGKTHPERCSVGQVFDPKARNGRGGLVEQFIPWDTATQLRRDDQMRIEIADANARANWMRLHAGMLMRLAQSVHGQPMQPAEPRRPEVIVGSLVAYGEGLRDTVIDFEHRRSGYSGRRRTFVILAGGKKLPKSSVTLIEET